MAAKLKVIEEVFGGSVGATAENSDVVPPPEAPQFEVAPTRKKHAGWTAERQRTFIEHLALTGSVGESAAIAFDRALHGRAERFYKDGELVMERKMPSDYLLTWLLSRLDPLQFGSPSAKTLAAATGDPRDKARNGLPELAAALADVEPADCPVESGDYLDERLGEVS